jgi:hypothetical protein
MLPVTWDTIRVFLHVAARHDLGRGQLTLGQGGRRDLGDHALFLGVMLGT